jgi:hypothetical protein
MLNSNRVISFVKSKLGFPFVQVEMEDADILDFVTEFSLREFSHYSPEVKRINLNITLDATKVPGRSNEYYINDDEGLEILNVKEIYFNMGNYVMMGHPPMGPLNHIGLREWALQTEMAMQTKMFSSFGDYTFEFTHPNVLRISPLPNNTTSSDVTVEYERIHNSDFSGVQNDIQILFCEFAAADVMMKIGRARKKYGGQMRTPFGEIPLSDDIYEEGRELKREIIEKLSLGPMLNKIVDFG